MVKPCPTLLTTGVCNDPGCDLKHDLHICRTCAVVSLSAEIHQIHLSGRRHLRALGGQTIIIACPVCNVNLSGSKMWKQHIESRRHARKAQAVGRAVSDIEPTEPTQQPGQVFCTVCKAFINDIHWGHHPDSKLHRRKLRYARFEAAFEEAAKDKHGISVSHQTGGLDFGITEVALAQNGVSLDLNVTNSVPLSKVVLNKVEVKCPLQMTSPFSVDVSKTPCDVISGRDISAHVDFKHTMRGSYTARLEFWFEDVKLHKVFAIIRTASAIVGDKEDYERLKPVAPFVPKKRTSREPETSIVEGVPPPPLQAIRYVVKLPVASIPGNVSAVLEQGSVAGIISHFRKSLLPRVLDSDTYGRHFKHLLWAEEYRSEKDLEVYDIPNAQLNKNNSYYLLDVPGLAEKRPSVLVGDQILVQPVGSDPGRWFQGFVHFVHALQVGLRFSSSFKHDNAQRYKVRFKLNRYPLRRQHQALDTVLHSERILFPATRNIVQTTTPSPDTIHHKVHNRLVAANPAQLQAVATIANQSPGSPTFVVFGPPGTGKTVTIVEAIRQLLDKNPNSRILACTPSNSAADLIATRLNTLSAEELFRFYAPSRHQNQVPDALQAYTCRTENGHFTAPPMAVLKRFRIIVSTCVSASFAHGVGLPRGHFTHIFIDEAGQATEPEAMISIKTMADNDTNVVLSGDPKQLGPIIRSAVARELGLERSYLARLVEREIYHEDNGHGITVVKLIQNFRSHPAILDFPNRQFYNAALQPYGNPQVINSFIGCPQLVNKEFPVIFHALSGTDDREASSPSFFNILESLQVKAYVQELRENRAFPISDDDIGVITPYYAQSRKIRAALKDVADGVKVGSVEEFQGQERRVVIISTVRSTRDFVSYDLKHTLGFVANPRRLNVAVTRAQALLIIVGDPTVLSLDPLWRSFLNYIHINGGWKGDAPTWDTSAPVRETGGYDEEMRLSGEQDMNDFARRMEEATLHYAAGEDDHMDEDNTDRPWMEVE